MQETQTNYTASGLTSSFFIYQQTTEGMGVGLKLHYASTLDASNKKQ